jgi:hypothetical protein
MARTLAPPTNDIDNAIATRQVELRRFTRKRKLAPYGKPNKEPKAKKAKKAKTTETEGAGNTIAETEAAPSLEPLSLENFGDSAVEAAFLAEGRKKQKQVPFVDYAVDEIEHTRDTALQQTVKSTMVKSEAAEVATTTHLIANAPRYEGPVKPRKAFVLAHTGTHMGSWTAPIVTDQPLMKVAPKLAAKKKMRKLKTMTNEMVIDEDGEEMRKKECVQSSLASHWWTDALHSYLNTPDPKYAAKKARVLSQPIHFVDRERCDTSDAPMEVSSSNIPYTGVSC